MGLIEANDAKRTMARAIQSGPSDARPGRGGGEWLLGAVPVQVTSASQLLSVSA